MLDCFAQRGVTALSIGANIYSASADVPVIYKWEDPLSKTSVIAMQNPYARAQSPPQCDIQGCRERFRGKMMNFALKMMDSVFKMMHSVFKMSSGGYGDGATIKMPNSSSTHALHLLFNGDNAGPHSVAQVEARFATLREEFPNAEVAGDSWDGFIDAIAADGSEESLELTTKEEGDTWIYGVQQDLYKTAAFRGIMRARRGN